MRIDRIKMEAAPPQGEPDDGTGIFIGLGYAALFSLACWLAILLLVRTL